MSSGGMGGFFQKINSISPFQELELVKDCGILIATPERLIQLAAQIFDETRRLQYYSPGAAMSQEDMANQLHNLSLGAQYQHPNPQFIRPTLSMEGRWIRADLSVQASHLHIITLSNNSAEWEHYVPPTSSSGPSGLAECMRTPERTQAGQSRGGRCYNISSGDRLGRESERRMEDKSARQSYSIGQMEAEANFPDCDRPHDMGMSRYGGHQHRPSRPSMLGDASAGSGRPVLGQLFEDEADHPHSPAGYTGANSPRSNIGKNDQSSNLAYASSALLKKKACQAGAGSGPFLKQKTTMSTHFLAHDMGMSRYR
ncbi:hypothetical protein NA57DRAFT_56628 [Rhizodiscina lignyota]|uniref:Uncharacterized protein n=1 Tax=Rhizodiscina lignyota TaxID=1504668 RepID=A0A9P4M692_9PEZI|nr:hypothetical protein NA57DRAFT_56628 [Rhizodiscina lignyota]